MIISGVMTIVVYLKDCQECRKSEILPSEFCPISGDWGKLGILNFAPMSLIKCYLNPLEGKIKPPPSSPRLSRKTGACSYQFLSITLLP